MLITVLSCFLILTSQSHALTGGLNLTLPIEARMEAAIPRIIGGSLAPINTYPWFAKTLYNDKSWAGCGGSLVTPEYVLTAAHCIISNTVPAKVQIGAFCNQDNNCGQDSQIVRVAKIIKHPGYNSVTVVNDFALLKLVSRVNVTDPVMLDQGNISPNYPPGKALHQSK